MKLRNLCLIMLLLIFNSCRKSDYLLEEKEIEYTDNGSGTGTVTWTNNKIWYIKGFVFVNDGQTLTIEPGTVIKFRKGQGSVASALIVARGGKIIAEGTKELPIIFTSEDDDLEGSLGIHDKGLWGGLIILGNAPINSPSGEAYIEGIPLSEPRIVFGGSDPEDNSGILKYVSIRHGGTEISDDNEINGLTLGGIGNKTTIEYIEVIANADDGVEFFGGTVNTKYMISAFNGDDAFDYDLGYQGMNQFWLGIQDDISGDHMIEADGGKELINSRPFSTPYIYNASFIAKSSPQLKIASFRSNAGGFIHNSIFVNFKHGVLLSYENGLTDSYSQWNNDYIKIENNIVYNVKNNISADIFQLSGNNPPAEEISNWSNYFSEGNNQIQDLGININQFLPQAPSSENLSPFPEEGAGFFEAVSYKGAFGTYLWTEGWPLLSKVEL